MGFVADALLLQSGLAWLGLLLLMKKFAANMYLQGCADLTCKATFACQHTPVVVLKLGEHETKPSACRYAHYCA